MAPKNHDPRLHAHKANYCATLYPLGTRYIGSHLVPDHREAEKLATRDAKSGATAHYGAGIKWRVPGITRLPFGILPDGNLIVACAFAEYEGGAVKGYRGMWGASE
jgi:hypothetical protein